MKKQFRNRSQSCASPYLRAREKRCQQEYDLRLKKDKTIGGKIGTVDTIKKGRRRRFLSVGLDDKQPTLTNVWKNMLIKANAQMNKEQKPEEHVEP